MKTSAKHLDLAVGP